MTGFFVKISLNTTNSLILNGCYTKIPVSMKINIFKINNPLLKKLSIYNEENLIKRAIRVKNEDVEM